MRTIVAVVEGDGEVTAFSGLLRKILHEKNERYDIQVGGKNVGMVNAHGKSKLLTKLEDFLAHAQRKPDCAGILVLLDADEDCPVTLANQLSRLCNPSIQSKPVTIVCANREYETWFLASLDTVKGSGYIRDTASLTGDAEDIRDPKKWLTDWMPPGQAYKPTTHQASLSSHIDLNLAHANSRSFRRLCHAVDELVDAIDRHQVLVTPVP